MFAINLLPWREKLRQQQLMKFKIIWLCSTLICMSVIIIWHSKLHQQYQLQESKAQQLQQQLIQIQTELKLLINTQQKIHNQQQMLETINLIEKNQWHDINLLALLSKITSPIIQFEVIDKKDKSITIDGKTSSLNSLSKFIQKLNKETTNWLDQPLLQKITTSNNTAITTEQNFTISIDNKPPS